MPTHPPRKAALVVAHPGHELRVHHWLEKARPQVFVLTDGSGHGEQGRLESTRRVLQPTGAGPGTIFGRWSDRDAYRLILEGDLTQITALILELAAQLEKAEVDTLVSDAVEGFNPVHDLCFLIAESAGQIVARRLGRPVQHFEILLEAAPDARLGSDGNGAVCIELDPAAWERKMKAAWEYEELRQEVERAIADHTAGAFRLEVLQPVAHDRSLPALTGDLPFYEAHGERRVADGTYRRVLRLREHFLPLAEAVRAWAAQA